MALSIFYWSFDDNIIAFDAVHHGTSGSAALHATSHLQGSALPCPLVQQIPTIAKFALTGFLRATGMESCKVRPLTSLIRQLRSTKFCSSTPLAMRTMQLPNYIPQLCKWEDIAFTHDLLCEGRRILKVQTFACHAVTTKGGGCEPVRVPAPSFTHEHQPPSHKAPHPRFSNCTSG